jgi:C4-dicarboxylate-specific signal transduction histidine kinase
MGSVVCDMMMPQKDGLQVCRELRERTATRNLPVLLLTARADEETKLNSLKAGASDFLSKPFSTTELHVRLKNLVDSHLFQKKLAEQNKILEATLEQLKETETQLVQSEKLAALGRLSAGIIHEINNPLNYARTALHLLRGMSDSMTEQNRAQFTDILRDIEEGVNRVKDIVSDLRTFTHPNLGAMSTVELSQVIESSARFLSHELKQGVKLDRQAPAGLKVHGNPSQLIQVLINLMQNAIDGVRRKKFPPGEQPTIRIIGEGQPGRTMVTVWDNGEGIAPEHLDKVFDPFFTTKDVGQGMGLGLSICYRIMQEHGGEIKVRSEKDKYCEFQLEFPDHPE